MKQTSLVMIATLLLAGSSAFAQSSKLAVKKGTKITYSSSTKIDVTQSVSGQESTINSHADGTAELAVKNLAGERIDWNYDIKKTHVVTKSAILPGGGKDTTIKGAMTTFATDLVGHLTVPPATSESDPVMAMMGGLQKTSMGTFFSPALAKALKAGDSWEENSIDTVSNPAMQGASIIIKRTTKYTFDGAVDTLKTSTSRVRADLTSMSLEGEAEMQGMKMTIDGDGTGQTNYYYTNKDGILFASDNSNDITMRIAMTGAMQMVIPVSYKVAGSTMRTSK